MKRKLMFLTFLLPLMLAEAQLPDASVIMSKSREMTLTGSMSATVNLSITEKNGSIRLRSISMTTKSYPGEVEKRFIKFLEPADVRGTAMLIIDNQNSQDEMWIYLPALKKTRRIVSSEKGKSFMSSEFSNSDMSSPALSDFKSRHLDGSASEKQWIIESIPVDEEKADEYGYTKKISFINPVNYQVSRMDFYNFDNELFKTVEIKSIYPLPNGRFIIKNMTAVNIVTGRKSEIAMTNISEGAKIDDALFTVQNLER